MLEKASKDKCQRGRCELSGVRHGQRCQLLPRVCVWLHVAYKSLVGNQIDSQRLENWQLSAAVSFQLSN